MTKDPQALHVLLEKESLTQDIKYPLVMAE
jgi:hypothetical protein